MGQIDQYPPFMIPPAYYTTPYNPGYLSELTGIMAGDLAVGPGPGVPAQQEEENSDLEVVDVISAKPAKKPRDPEVVELSDSESEAESEEQQETETVQPPVDHGYTSGILAPSYMRMSLISSFDPHRSQGSLKKSTKKAPPPPAESSDEDDLIVVKTEHNTIDPITKRQIVEPVKNKKCNHIYEKSTIYSMIDLARENSKPVKCPYMGCNCRDFKKTDLIKDKEVLGHIHVLKEEQIKADKERKERERKAVEKRKKNKGGGYASDVSITIDGDDDSPDLAEFELPGIEAPNLSESSSDETNVAKTSSKNTNLNVSQSSDSFVESSSSKKTVSETEAEKPKKSLPSELSSQRAKKKKKKTQERLSVSSQSESSDSSDSDLPPLSRLGRVRKQPRRLNDSYNGSDLDGSENDLRKKGSKKKGKSPKKVKIVSKKVTETWSYEKAGAALKKGKKRRKKRSDYEDENSQEEESEDEVEAAASKGKSSKGKPPKNSSFSRNRPKRAKKVSYQEFDEEF